MNASYPYLSCVSPNNEFATHDFYPALIDSLWGMIPVWFCPDCLYIVNADGTVREQTTIANDEQGEYLVFAECLEHRLPKKQQRKGKYCNG